MAISKKDVRARLKTIKELYTSEDPQEAQLALDAAETLVHDLFENKQFDDLVDAFRFPGLDEDIFYGFEMGYALDNRGYKDDAERVYEYMLCHQPNNSSILNNLSNLKKARGLIKEAWELIERAKKIEPDDEIISRNYANLATIRANIEETDRTFKSAAELIQNENDFVLGKLENFLKNVKNENGYKDGKLPIPFWRFSVLIGTDKEKADSLREQWLRKGYIAETGGRGDHGEKEYRVNPYIEERVTLARNTKLNPKWIEGYEKLTIEELKKFGYFELLEKVGKIKKDYRDILVRDFNELSINFVLGNEKSTLVLGGSVVETLLMYQCDKKKVKVVQYQQGGKSVNKKLEDCTLYDLLSYFEQTSSFSDLLSPLGHISRIHRNFIHPGKEIKSKQPLDGSKANLCFLSVIEIMKIVL